MHLQIRPSIQRVNQPEIAVRASNPPYSSRATYTAGMSRRLHFAWVLLLGMFLLPCATARGQDWITLFDGKTLEGWSGDPQFWSVQDGAIVGRSTPKNRCTRTTYLHHDEQFEDFELVFEIKLEGDGANSGMQYRSTPRGKDFGDGFDLSGYQADLDSNHSYSGILYETNGRGITVLRGESVKFDSEGNKLALQPRQDDAALKTHLAKGGKDGWHTYRILARGGHLEHWIDGTRMVLVEDEYEKRIPRGVLALQIHQGKPMTLRARNIRIKPLRTPNAPTTKK